MQTAFREQNHSNEIIGVIRVKSFVLHRLQVKVEEDRRLTAEKHSLQLQRTLETKKAEEAELRKLAEALEAARKLQAEEEAARNKEEELTRLAKETKLAEEVRFLLNKSFYCFYFISFFQLGFFLLL